MMTTNRRTFIKQLSAISAGTAIIPGMLSCSPSNKLNIAVIGVGGRGSANWKPCAGENIVALCDVDDNLAAEGFETFPKAARYKDFRKMFDQMAGEIDAVLVSIPDHAHFAAAMAAMQLGKHVYVEKPLAHNVWQVRTLKKAAEYYNVITQMGNQGHATDGIRRVKEWVDAGITGEVKEVFAWINGPKFKKGSGFDKPGKFPPPEEPIPEGFDWDLWLGQAAYRPYNHIYAPKSWRAFYDFGNGKLGDWGCHTLDAPFWALNPGMPAVVRPEAHSGNPEGFVPQRSVIHFEFPGRNNKPPVRFSWFEGGLKPENRPEWKIDELPDSGMIMVGERQNIITGLRPNNARLMMSQAEWESWKENEMPEAIIPRVKGGPVKEFLRAIKNDGPLPGSNFNYSAALTEMILLGVMSQRFNKRIEYDAGNMKVLNHPELAVYIKEPARPGWEYGENLL